MPVTIWAAIRPGSPRSWTIAIDIIVKTADPMPNEDVRPEAGALAMQLALRADHSADRCREEEPPDDLRVRQDR